jgi:hypothetical protein
LLNTQVSISDAHPEPRNPEPPEFSKEWILAEGSSYQYVERLDLTSLTWTRLEDTPEFLDYATLVRAGEDLLLVNPNVGNIMRFSETELKFHEVENNLHAKIDGIGDSKSVVMAIGDDSLHCAHN